MQTQGRRLGVARSALMAMLILGMAIVAASCTAQEVPEGAQAVAEDDKESASADLVRLHPDHNVWIDRKRKRVVMTGEIVLREGPLELFACLKNTKEHEAIVAVETKAFVVHSALLAVGAEPGGPVQFLPEYKPAHGTKVDVTVFWTDARGKRRNARAQDWVLNNQTKKSLDQDWVFGGSGFWRDEDTGEEFYQAEDGDFICVSNFASAMLDLPIESTGANDALLFDAYTERIPPLKTRVTLLLTPRLGKKDAKPDEEKE